MSAIGDKDLVRVRSHDELRAGMTIVFKPCRRHGKPSCASVILQKIADGGPHMLEGDGRREPCPWPWALIHTHCEQRGCLCKPLGEGRVYRLRDLDDSADGREVVAKPTAAVLAKWNLATMTRGQP